MRFSDNSSMSLVKKQKVNGTNGGGIGDDEAVSSGRILHSSAVALQGHQGAVYCGDFNQDGTLIVSGGADKAINLWKLPVEADDDSINLGYIQGHKSGITSITWMADDYELASASGDMTLALWDIETGKKVKNCKNQAIINDIDYNDASSLILSGDDDGKVKLWDKREKLPVFTVETEYPILSCTFNNLGSNLYFSGIDPTVNAFDIRNSASPLWTCSGPIDSIVSLAINNDDSMLVSRSMRGSVNTYNAKDIIPETSSRPSPYMFDGAPSNNEYKLIRSCFSNDNINIFSGSDDKTVTMWDVTSRKVMDKFPGHEGSVLDISVHPTEKIVMSTSLDGTIIVREY